MQKAKVDILPVLFAYGGNGGTSSVIPQIAVWWGETLLKMKADERIGRIGTNNKPLVLSDTPITLTRNKAVRLAQENGFDMILMLDSDNEPDGYLGRDPSAKPFWDEAFTFAYDRLIQGTPTVIAAPYCGPPPHPCPPSHIIDGGEVPSLFEWRDDESDTPHPRRKLEMLNRNEAARLRGIYPIAALPTGVSLFTTNCFEGLPKPYFDYEWNEDHSEKASTEDVYCTRNISLHWGVGKGISVLYAACDSWALHHKPKKVGKPRTTPVESMSESFRRGIKEGFSALDAQRYVDFALNLPSRGQVLGPDDNEVVITEEMRAKAQLEIDREQGQLATQRIATAVAAEPLLADDLDLWEGEGLTDDSEPGFAPSYDGPTNGEALRHKMIGGCKVAILGGFEVPEPSLEGLEMLANWLANRKDGGGLEVAVVHPGTGQGTAAILSALPEGSHVHAYDCTAVYQLKSDYATQFRTTFFNAESSAKVKSSLGGKAFPWPEEPQHLDMVYLERFMTEEKLEKWLVHIQPGGILCGLGYSDPKLGQLLENFQESRGLKLRTSGDVWAIPVS